MFYDGVIMKKAIYLQKIGDVEASILIKMKKNLKWVLKEYIDSVKIVKKQIPIVDFPYNPISKQYDGSYIFNLLDIMMKKENHFRTLGVIDEDIYVDTLNFIFGRAKYPKNDFYKYHGLAMISVARLKENFYRRAPNESLRELRVLKEAIHELGHTFNLGHCNNHCVMQFSKHIGETDDKPVKYCKSCSKKLSFFFGSL
ncbi:MAG: archemetzincin [Promethearchaeota archaeon]|nr:MAG: archemetzincin [Candidatus Lokiarchaeota archaeon]